MLSNRRLVTACAVLLLCNTALLIIFVKYNVAKECYIQIDHVQNSDIKIPDDFLSFGIDTSDVEESIKLNFTSRRLIQLTHELAPARLRLGGTMSQRLIFSKDDLPPDLPVTCENCAAKSKSVCNSLNKLCAQKVRPFFIMTGSAWDSINNFCNATNVTLLFGFNVLLRSGENWFDNNAVEILDYTRAKGYNVDWQLGNEPNSFPHVFNVNITPVMLAQDFKHLRELLNAKGFNQSLLVGPDTTRPQPKRPECLNYMIEFLQYASHNISVRSWHQYYLNSRTAKLEDFWNPNTFDLLEEQILLMIANTSIYNNIPMWLSETSSSYGGGAQGLSNSFAGSPLWLDKLGLTAKYNITTVVRQSLNGGNYCLIDHNLNPLPDWWLSVLFKKLVGNKVLQLECKCSRFQRMYVHCANKNYTNDTTAITIFGMNLEMANAKFFLNGTAFSNVNLSIDEFILRAPSNNRKSKIVLLNGLPLVYDDYLPDFNPVRIKYARYISMPPYSIGFWVVKDTSIKVCI